MTTANLKQYVSHSSAWVDHNRGRLKIGERFLINDELHIIKDDDAEFYTMAHINEEGDEI